MLLRGGARVGEVLKARYFRERSFDTRKTDRHIYISFCASSTLLHHVSAHACRTYQI